jgi:hypothetical protein
VISGLVFVNSDDSGNAWLSTFCGFDSNCLSRFLLVGALFFFAAVYYVLFRFRIHQCYTEKKNCPMSPLGGVLGAQTFLQLATCAQLTIIYWLIRCTYGKGDVTWPIVVLAVLTLIAEGCVLAHRAAAKPANTGKG